ncbi:similar to protein N-methyltransferase [Haematococcus lacustris]|uniref:Similar to protein N-methyltransferase n=1 Tax=Haematococcus lacustris TaxID=44745 RepID=A0A699ZU99_HAELA|nr:similar to protein N-methyltransferase [Haematococcus lacustris]
MTGVQVFISYGELSNDALLQQYGFVEPDNPHDRRVFISYGELSNDALLQQYMLTGLGSQLLRGPLAQALSPTEALTAAVEGEAARGGLEEVVSLLIAP